MSLFLSPDELHELTGYARKSKQIEWLRRRRWRFEVTREGFPRVARAHYDRRMVADDELEPAARLPKRPNFALIRQA